MNAIDVKAQQPQCVVKEKKSMYYFNFIKGTSGISAQNGVEYDITQSLNKIQNKEVKKNCT